MSQFYSSLINSTGHSIRDELKEDVIVRTRGQQNRNEKEVCKFQVEYLNCKHFGLHKNKLLQRVISRILHTQYRMSEKD